MSTPRILIVDDDRSVCTVVEKLLSREGYEVDSTTDATAAVDQIMRNHYDLLVLDYQMPVMNGVEIFRQARELQPEIAGVFLTAHARIDTVFPAIEAGVERVFAKPLDARELLPVVKQLVDQAAQAS